LIEKKKQGKRASLFLTFFCASVARMARASNALGLLVLGLALIEPTKALGFTGEFVSVEEPWVMICEECVDSSGNLEWLIEGELMDLPPPDEWDSYAYDFFAYDAYSFMERDSPYLHELVDNEWDGEWTPPPTSDAVSSADSYLNASSNDVDWSFGSITEAVQQAWQPPAMSSAVEQQGQAPGCASADLSQYLRAAGNLSTFAAVWNERKVAEYFIPNGLKYTILAPTDAAFQDQNLDENSVMDIPIIDRFLLHHVSPQMVSSLSEFASLGSIETATCDRVELADGPTIDGTATMRHLSPNSSGNNSTCEITWIEASGLKGCGIDLYRVSCVFPPIPQENWADPLCIPY